LITGHIGRAGKELWLTLFFYAALLSSAGAALLRMYVQGGEPNWLTLMILLVAGCAATRLRLQLPGVGPAVSLWFPFSFAAVTEQPALYAWGLFCAVQGFDAVLDPKHREGSFGAQLERLLFRVSSMAIGVWAASSLYRGFSVNLPYPWVLGTGIAAVAYFFVVSSLDSIQTSLHRRVSPWAIWGEEHFWTSPIYILASFGVMVTKLLIEAESSLDTALGIGVMAAAYGYLRTYFPKLHDQQDHAQKLADIRQRALETLAVAIEAKDGSTAGHLRRVRSHVTRLGNLLGCSPLEIRTLQLAAVLHDVGKVGVPDYILTKPSRLTDQEFEQIAAHTTIGAEIVSTMHFPEPVEEVVRGHHEHWDGSGYPRGLKGSDIPRLARMLTVVDCFDALVTERPYRRALPVDEALVLMRRQRAKIFDPEILDSFLEMLPAYLPELKDELAKERKTEEKLFEPVRKVRQTWVEKGVQFETSARLMALQKLSRHPEHLVAAHDILNMLGSDLDFQRDFQRAMQVLARSCEAELAGVFVPDRDQGAFTLLIGEGFPAHSAGRVSVERDQGVFGRAAELRIPMIADAPPGPLSGAAERCFENVRCTLAAPLIAGDRVVGVVAVCSRRPRAFGEAQGLLLSLITEKLAASMIASRRLRRLHIDAQTDAVTSLPNARTSFHRLEQEVNRAERERRTLGVLFLDLNGLKPVNDSYGHSAGDRLLASTAERLRKSLRSYDFVGRIGGDEFLALLPGISRKNLENSVKLLKDAVAEKPVELAPNVHVRPMISIGSALYPSDSQDPDELIMLSDKGMYADKELYRKREAAATRRSAKAGAGGEAPRTPAEV